MREIFLKSVDFDIFAYKILKRNWGKYEFNFENRNNFYSWINRVRL